MTIPYIVGIGILIMAAFAAVTLWAACRINQREEERAEREYQKLLAEMQKERSKAG